MGGGEEVTKHTKKREKKSKAQRMGGVAFGRKGTQGPRCNSLRNLSTNYEYRRPKSQEGQNLFMHLTLGRKGERCRLDGRQGGKVLIGGERKITCCNEKLMRKDGHGRRSRLFNPGSIQREKRGT